jgi:CheY-like chemotaxis protein
MDGLMLTAYIRSNESIFGYPKILILSSLNLSLDEKGLEEHQLDGFLTKPVLSKELFLEINKVFRQKSNRSVIRDKGCTQPKLKKIKPLKILYAEDDIINQKLGKAVFGNQGHDITIAHNGAEAVELFCKHNYDVILMDVQMPEMDGYEATRKIRAIEQERGGHIPIIAMTAHAIKTYKDLCLEAGMDHYISKPIKQEQVFDLLASIFGMEDDTVETEINDAQAAEPVLKNGYCFDIHKFKEQCMNDLGLMKDISGLLLKSGEQQFRALNEAVLSNSFQEINEISHKMRGTISAFNFAVLTENMRKLEAAAKTNNHLEIASQWPHIERDFARLMNDVKRFVQEH